MYQLLWWLIFLENHKTKLPALCIVFVFRKFPPPNENPQTLSRNLLLQRLPKSRERAPAENYRRAGHDPYRLAFPVVGGNHEMKNLYWNESLWCWCVISGGVVVAIEAGDECKRDMEEIALAQATCQ